VTYGFLIDNRKCIGCHACSTACKSENQVPLGVNRTWVKVTEQGRYPDVTRNFQVTRCNHCANPPCVRICPVTAMYQRHDGIVEFDSEQCIGCKGCMQACPYDAIYIDPESSTAAKCHFCAHRVETGLEPACVVVCPEHAIVAGDLDDPKSEISQLMASHATTVRKPEQGTAPKLHYIEGNDVSMHPTALPREPEGMMFADVLNTTGGVVKLRIDDGPPLTRTSASGTALRAPQPQGEPFGGPIHVGEGRMAGQMVQVAYNAQHQVPWHWQVPAYLVTKGIASGAFLLLALGAVTGIWPVAGPTAVLGGGLGIAMLLATTALLVADLERPERFLRIVLRPQWRSWITRGAFVLIGFTNVALAWWAVETAAWLELWTAPAALRTALAGLTLPLAFGGAVYTAFLFAQAEGRDLWQSPLLPVHMFVQAVVAGAAGLAVLGLAGATAVPVASVLGVALVVDLLVLGLGELGIPHASEIAAAAAHDITHGRYRRIFWWGAIALGHLVPLVLLSLGGGVPLALAGLCAIGGLYAYEHAFVMAPQQIPNS